MCIRDSNNREQLSYIGEIDKSGQINRREISSSNAINMKIIEVQREYAKQREQKKMQKERGD